MTSPDSLSWDDICDALREILVDEIREDCPRPVTFEEMERIRRLRINWRMGPT